MPRADRVNKIKVQTKWAKRMHDLVNWAGRHCGVLSVAIMLVPLLYIVLVLAEHEGSIVVVVFLSTLLLLTCGMLAIALFEIVQQLKVIRCELATISTRADVELLGNIAADLAAMRAQMGKGVFGLLGT